MTHPEDVTLDWHPRTGGLSRKSLLYSIADNFNLHTTPRTRNWTRSVWLNQGREGACTGFGMAHCMDNTPRRWVMTEDAARTCYYEAQRRDEWHGESYSGSSVLGAMEAAMSFGWLNAYYWATSLDEIVHGVSLFGPMEIGVNWYEGMMDPDSAGYLNATGPIVGGHALCLSGVNMTYGFFELDNSWGKGWGVNGSARMSFATVDRLRREQGEFALPRKKLPNVYA